MRVKIITQENRCLMIEESDLEIKNINHLGIIAGIIDDLGIEEIINQEIGVEKGEIVTSGQIVKAIILNGLGFVSRPLYLFPQFFLDKPVEHLIGKGILPEHLNEYKIGRTMDLLYAKDLSNIFLSLALNAVEKYQIKTDYSHLDASSISMQGEYKRKEKMAIEGNKLEKEVPINITYGYSRDRRPDLKQFILDLIVSGDGDIPLFLRVADGNESDKAVFGQIAKQYKSMVTFDTMIVSDSALYSENNLKFMGDIFWLSRVPLTLKEAQRLINETPEEELTKSTIEGYSWLEVESNYGGIKQRWLIVESEKAKVSDLKKLEEKIKKENQKGSKDIEKITQQGFKSEQKIIEKINELQNKLKYHKLENINISQSDNKKKAKKKKTENEWEISYQITATLEANSEIIEDLKRRSGRFILATNQLEKSQLSSDDILIKYKEQQAPERGFRFIKDPLFFADSVFLKSPERIETMAMLMGLCLLVYSIGQRELRKNLESEKTGLKNQLGKSTNRPTLRWIFQCFQGIHYVILSGIKKIINLTEDRREILNFFPPSCQKYYILSG
jgi:transposase